MASSTASVSETAETTACETTRLFPDLPAAQWHLISSTVQDRIVGTLVGSALGDAIGLYTEFLNHDQSTKAYPSRKFVLHPKEAVTPFYRDMHRLKHQHGEWTDDTDHALLILLSFLHSNGTKLDPIDLASRLQTWVQMGLRALDTPPLGLGRTTGLIVRKKEYLSKPVEVARDMWIRSKRNIAPNGSLMRTHPLGLMCLTKTLEQTFEIAASYSVVTHADPRCVVACAIGTALVRGLVLGEITSTTHLDATIDAGIAWYTTHAKLKSLDDETYLDDAPLDTAELRQYASAANLPALKLDDPHSIGYVYKTFGSGILLLRLALWQMDKDKWDLTSQTIIFEELITELIMQGGDADTNACFAGALLGALLGYKALPTHWREGLRHGEWLLGKAHALCKVVKVVEGEYDGAQDRDTRLDGGRGFLTPHEMDGKWAELTARMAREETGWRERREVEEREKAKGGGGFLGMLKRAGRE